MADDLAALARDCGRLAADLRDRALVGITEHAAYDAKGSSLIVLRSVVGGDQRPSRFGMRGNRKRPVRFGVGYDLGTPGKATINFRPRGGWVMFDIGARDHVIGSGRRRTARGRYTGRRNQRQVLAIGDDRVLGPIRHPGMAGKRMFTRAVREINDGLEVSVAEAFVKVTRGQLVGRRG